VEYTVESLHARDYPFAFLVRTDSTVHSVVSGRIIDTLTRKQRRELVKALRRAASTIEDSYTSGLVDN
jgi:hypothetical protein